MREIEKVVQLFEAFYKGDCWIGLNFQQAIDGIDANQAYIKKGEGQNSIWQLVNHIIYWRKTVIIRLQGVLGHPPMNDFYQPEKSTQSEWEKTLVHFAEVNQALLETIGSFDNNKLDQPSPKKGQTYYNR
jgi:uncharacterized damage-inducible protein DinB